MHGPRLYHFAMAAAGATAAALFTSGAAWAHPLGLSRSDFTIAPDGAVHAELVFAAADAEAADDDLAARVAEGTDVRADGARCPGEVTGAAPAEGDAVRITATFTCAPSWHSFRVALPFLAALPATHRHVLRLASGATTTQTTLTADHPEAELRRESVSSTAPSGPLAFLRLGIAHILTGWDHLLFLVTLLAGERRLRGAAVLVTTFTIAHSFTLALAALGLVTPPARIVEALIALSIAAVGFFNLAPLPSPKSGRGRGWGRPATVFAFGLLHGFGFASALGALALSGRAIVAPLFAFNAGVETGQLAVVALAIPALAWLRRHVWFERAALPALSLAAALTGLALCAARLAG